MEPFEEKYVVDAAAPKPEVLFNSQPVAKVGTDAIGRWITMGWASFRKDPGVSAIYGTIFAVIGILINLGLDKNSLAGLSLTAGFVLVAPFLSLGLYDIARGAEQGRKVSFAESAQAIRNNMMPLMVYAIFVLLMFAAWILISTILTGALAKNIDITSTSYFGLLRDFLNTENGGWLLFAFFAIGLVFETIVFVTGVVTVQMMLDRKVDMVTAGSTSWRVVKANPLTMFVWAITLVALTIVGMLPFYLGLIVTMPLAAFASWHAYRDLVK